jgi:hypothetical protein
MDIPDHNGCFCYHADRHLFQIADDRHDRIIKIGRIRQLLSNYKTGFMPVEI